MTMFTTRPVAVFNLPISPSASILKPEQIVLRFANRNSVDIGALCYLQREIAVKGNHAARRTNQGRKILLSSLCSKRVEHIRKFIIYISNEVRDGGRRPSTLYSVVLQFTRFMGWADENGHSDALDNSVLTLLAVRNYAGYIRERVQTHKISLNWGAAIQIETLNLLSEFLGIENLKRGLNLLSGDSNSSNPTEPPSEEDQGRVLSLCEALFNGLTTLVLDAKPYPFGVPVPSYLGYRENILWIFPLRVWCLPVLRIDSPGTTSHGAGYIYSTGRLATREELMGLKKYNGKSDIKTDNRTRVTKVLSQSRNVLDCANSSPTHPHRRYMGMMALNAFIPMFLSRTSMNWSDFVTLQWSGSYKDSVSTIRQKFRSIKFRAGSKEVNYQLPLKFMPLFRRYLQLRDYLLASQPEYDGLFFTMGRRMAGDVTPIKTSLEVTYRMLERIDPELTPVLSRGWRAGKSDWLLSRTDVSTTSRILQNSERTVLKSYAAGSFATHHMEMSTFMDRMVVDRGVEFENNAINAVGGCESYGAPREIHGLDAIVKPDCDNPEGCLYCDKFKVHADETDVRKLLSCSYCLERTSHLAGFHAMSEPLLRRIQLILDEIRKRDPSLVQRVTQEVLEGELDPYWAIKFDMLLRLSESPRKS